MSDIQGEGYGSDHTWKKGCTITIDVNLYKTLKLKQYHCIKCNHFFDHFYDEEPDIFEAMKSVNVPEFCLNK